MKYLKINENNCDHVIKIYLWLLNEVLSSGGDGDGIWYSKYFSVDDIIENVRGATPKHWSIKKETDKSYLIYHDQEYLFITNHKTEFDNRSEWQQVSLAF